MEKLSCGCIVNEKGEKIKLCDLHNYIKEALELKKEIEGGGENLSEKKVVSRNVAIALGIICMILAVGLVGVIANYTSIINNKDGAIQSKDSQIQTLTNQKNRLQTWLDGNLSLINTLNTQIINLQNQVNDLNSIINLEKSTVWVDDQTVSQPAGSYTYWTVSASYAGYVSVWVQTSTTDNTYARVIWSSHGVNYDESITVGVSGTAVFPILPTSSIEIRVGNSNWFSGATETVTITYHY